MTGKKILLALLPYWTPLIPPQGITSLKVFLEKNGWRVKTVDANIEQPFKAVYQEYFSRLSEFIPDTHRGNFYNVGHDVLRNHLMAGFNRDDEEQYNRLVRILVNNTFFWDLDDRQLQELNSLIDRFYLLLERYCLNLMEEEKPAAVGLSAHLGTLAAVLYSFKLVKERYPGALTVMGGSIFAGEMPRESPDFTFLQEKAPYVDKFIIGEGEELLLELLEGRLPASKRVYSRKDLENPRREIAAQDLPDLADLDVRSYPYVAARGSRSCPFQCSFCNVAGFFGEYTEKSARQTADEMIELYRRYGNQLYFLTDSLLNPIITALASELISRDVSLYMDSYMRVSEEVGDRENTLLWRRGGLYRVRMGIESGSQRILDLMDKRITVEQSKAAISSLAHAGIKTTAYLVVGYPGETEEDFRQTLAFIEEMRDDIWQVECNPFYYYYTGQNRGDKWAGKRKLLYPDWARDLLVCRTWIVDEEPSREERFRRIFRMTEHCKKLGIPNPYSSQEIFEADERWRQLHENAVPSLIEFQNSSVYIDENRKVKGLISAQTPRLDESDFIF